MPFVLIFIGLLLVIAGVRGQEGQLMSLVESDIVGNGSLKNSYFAWILAIGVLGGLGYIKAIRPLANAFLVLVILILFLSNKGFFTQFNTAISSSLSNASSSSGSSTNSSSSSSSSNPLSSIMSLFGGGASGANSNAATANSAASSIGSAENTSDLMDSLSSLA